CGCTDEYVIAPDTLARWRGLPEGERSRTALRAHHQFDNRDVWVRPDRMRRRVAADAGRGGEAGARRLALRRVIVAQGFFEHLHVRVVAELAADLREHTDGVEADALEQRDRAGVGERGAADRAAHVFAGQLGEQPLGERAPDAAAGDLRRAVD